MGRRERGRGTGTGQGVKGSIECGQGAPEREMREMGRCVPWASWLWLRVTASYIYAAPPPAPFFVGRPFLRPPTADAHHALSSSDLLPLARPA